MLPKYLINICFVLTILSQIFCIPITDHEDSEQLDYTNRVDNLNRVSENLNDNQIKTDVQQTIDQVQKMLDGDPNLPRLTKGEIEDLFEQVTREEYEKSLSQGDISRAEHMRALMLVLPYNTDNGSDQNLEELFNRPPVTKIVTSSEPKPQKPLRPVILPSGKVEIISIGKPMEITTYKPMFRRKFTKSSPTPITTYHPGQSFSRSPTASSIDLSDNFEIISISRNEKPIIPLINMSDYPEKFEFTEDIKLQTTEKPQRFSSHYNAKTINLKQDIYLNRAASTENSRKTTKTTSRDLEDVLNSLGFSTQTKTRKHFEVDEDFSEAGLPKPIISSIIKQDRVSVEEPIPVKIEDFRKGLLPQPKTDAFTAFKPLNLQTSVQIEPGLEDYLIKFGILENGRNSRSQKVLNAPPIIEKNLPSTTRPKTTTTSTTPEKSTTKLDIIKRIDTNIDEAIADGSNIFKPTQTDKDDFQELGRLLKNLRELQGLRVNLTADSLNKLELKNYNLSDSLLSQGPNPIDMPEFGDLLKNEVKRQENDTAETAPTRFSLSLDDSDLPADDSSKAAADNDSTTANNSDIQTITEINDLEDDTSLTTTTTTEESPNGSLSDLEDSFGKADPVSEKPFPPPRKNGFYFLADINSFLEVGDGAEKVLVRFNPQIGDPSRFIPVKVP